MAKSAGSVLLAIAFVTCNRELKMDKRSGQTRICNKCAQEKDISEFRHVNKTKNWLNRSCRSCDCDRTIRARTKKHYGITVEQYENMLIQQDNKCKICGSEGDVRKLSMNREYKCSKPRKLYIDHVHGRTENGKPIVRALLCRKCNSLCGYLDDNPEMFRKVVKYLETDGKEILGG